MLRLSIALLVFTTSLQAQKQPIGTGRVAGQLAAGLVAAPLGFAIGYTVGSGFRPHGQSNSGVALGFAGALFAPPTVVSAIGSGSPPRGNFAATVGGAALGYGAMYFAVPAAMKVGPTKLKIAALIAAFALPGVGATVAYNATRK